MAARKPRHSQLARAVALLTREIRKGFGSVVRALGGIENRLEAVELEVAALRARRPSVRPPKA